MDILLIDDEKDCLLSMASAIEPAGHHISMFTVSEQAVKAYEELNFDLVITDIKMPGVNGIQVLEELRLMNPAVRVIITTGYVDVDTAIAALNNGAYAFFGKPVAIEDLLLTIEKIEREIIREKKTQEDQVQMAKEYRRLKKDYEGIQNLLKKVTEGGDERS